MVLDTRPILVIEDDALVASSLCEVLQDLGFSKIGPASSGPEALSLAELHKPDIAIVDIGLSGEMDGIDIARAFEERFGIAVIFLSGQRDEKVIARARAVHPVRFLHKPFRASALLDAIETARGVRLAAATKSPPREGIVRTPPLRRRYGDNLPMRPVGEPVGDVE